LCAEKSKRTQEEILGYFEQLTLTKPEQSSDDEEDHSEDEDFVKLLKLEQKKGMSEREFVHGVVSIMKMLARGDREDEAARKETLSKTFVTQNLQPKAYRDPISLSSCYIKVMVPVLTETF
jgi:hypothetical protein